MGFIATTKDEERGDTLDHSDDYEKPCISEDGDSVASTVRVQKDKKFEIPERFTKNGRKRAVPFVLKVSIQSSSLSSLLNNFNLQPFICSRSVYVSIAYESAFV